MRDYIPSAETELLVWSQNFQQHIAAMPEQLGVNAHLLSDYESRHEAFARLHDQAANPNTRTPVVIAEKKVAKALLTKKARQIAQWIQAQPSTTDAQRMTLGLRIQKKTNQRIGPPTEPPEVEISGFNDRSVTVHLRRSDGRAAKPEGVASAALFIFIGEQAPQVPYESSHPQGWTFAGSTNRGVVHVETPALHPGQNIWVCAYWQNRRGEYGPISKPASLFRRRVWAMAA